MQSAQTWRQQRERRYHLDRPTAAQLLADLAAHLPPVIYQPGSDRTFVVTTYLDTADGHYLTASRRSSLKMRIREYLWQNGAPTALAYSPYCYLERKHRRGEVRDKVRILIEKSQIADIVSGRREVPGESPEAEAIRSELQRHTLLPMMVSAYERRVFGDGEELRVTFDERVGFHPAPRDLYARSAALTPEVLGAPLARGPARILEVKSEASAAWPAWLEELLRDRPIADDYSKFRDGMAALAASDGRPVSLTASLPVLSSPPNSGAGDPDTGGDQF